MLLEAVDLECSTVVSQGLQEVVMLTLVELALEQCLGLGQIAVSVQALLML
jgi:hypothetical protein